MLRWSESFTKNSSKSTRTPIEACHPFRAPMGRLLIPSRVTTISELGIISNHPSIVTTLPSEVITPLSPFNTRTSMTGLRHSVTMLLLPHIYPPLALQKQLGKGPHLRFEIQPPRTSEPRTNLPLIPSMVVLLRDRPRATHVLKDMQLTHFFFPFATLAFSSL